MSAYQSFLDGRPSNNPIDTAIATAMQNHMSHSADMFDFPDVAT